MLEARGGRISFFALFPAGVTREHVVVTFLAVLEMIKLGLVRCEQGKLRGDHPRVDGDGRGEGA